MPPDDQALVKAFLKTDDYLLFSVNLYNSLGLGLTQLKNETYVYNKKRYEEALLLGRTFSFKRPNNGYPSKMSLEFLLVDLVNNINSVGEEPDELKQRIVYKLNSGNFDIKLLTKLCQKHGKVGTKKFFNAIIQ